MSIVLLVYLSLALSQYSEDDFELDMPPILEETTAGKSADIIPEIEKPTFYMEAGMLCFLFLFFVNLYVGKQKNERTAKDWLFLLKPLFQENFSHTGAADTEGEGEML